MAEEDREHEEGEQRLTDTIKQRGACLQEVENSTVTVSLRHSGTLSLSRHYITTQNEREELLMDSSVIWQMSSSS